MCELCEMEAYPHEVRARPRPVIVMIGCSDLHPLISQQLPKVNVDPATPSLRVCIVVYVLLCIYCCVCVVCFCVWEEKKRVVMCSF